MSNRLRLTRHVLFSFVLVLLLAALSSISVSAQEPTPSDDEVNAIAKQLYCPVCENTPLDVCPTEACRQWRALIRQQLGDGWTEDQIKQYFVDNYGVRVLAEPPRSGLNWLLYLLPPLIILIGAVVLFRALLIWNRESNPAALPQDPGGSSAPEPKPVQDEYVARLEEELRKRK